MRATAAQFASSIRNACLTSSLPLYSDVSLPILLNALEKLSLPISPKMEGKRGTRAAQSSGERSRELLSCPGRDEPAHRWCQTRSPAYFSCKGINLGIGPPSLLLLCQQPSS